MAPGLAEEAIGSSGPRTDTFWQDANASIELTVQLPGGEHFAQVARQRNR